MKIVVITVITGVILAVLFFLMGLDIGQNIPADALKI